MLRFVCGRRSGISSTASRRLHRHWLAARPTFAQRAPQPHAHWIASLTTSRMHSHLPTPHEKRPLFRSFSPHISTSLPPLLFGAASRARVRAHITRAHQSVFIFCLHLFTHLAYFTISQRITCEGFGVFSFTPLVPWLHPESKEFSSRLFAKNRHQSRRNRGEQNGESKGEGKKQKPSPLNSSRSTFCDR